MSNLIPITHKGQRILTTDQLAQVYETDVNNIQANFKRNESHFIEGVHYFKLEGAALKEFKNQPTMSQLVSKHTSQLYLWTERGASRHCKILDTDKAWEQFDHLEETYFKVKESRLLQADSYMIDDPIERAKAWIREAEERKALALQIEEQKPKAEAFDTFMDGANNQKMNIVAKSLNIGRNKLFQYLRDKHILMADNTPYQEYIDRGYFVVKQKPITMGDETINKPQTFVTPKGVEYIRRILGERKAG